MQEKNFDWLNYVPYRGKDADKELENIIVASSTSKSLSVKEKQRLDYEMEIIKKFGAAKVFLFGCELVGNDCCGTTLLAEGCSFINYLLGINKVNPVLYDLPFQRFFNLSKGEKPVYNIYTTKGDKEKILKHLYRKFGENLFFQNRTNTAIYYVSSKPEENQNIASHGDKSMSLKYRKPIESDFYRFGILDNILKIDNSVTSIFTEKEILRKQRELFGERNSPVWEYTTINEVVDFLKDTEY